MKNKKLSLKDLAVKSFKTSLDKDSIRGGLGTASDGQLCTREDICPPDIAFAAGKQEPIITLVPYC